MTVVTNLPSSNCRNGETTLVSVLVVGTLKSSTAESLLVFLEDEEEEEEDLNQPMVTIRQGQRSTHRIRQGTE